MVSQSFNYTPMFVPNEDSLSGLFLSALEKSGLDPQDITYVEAHGTGTPVGDPVEFTALCNVLGGSNRSHMLQVGSVKGLIGHTEGVSGLASLIKVLLMFQKAAIPPQASFRTINTALTCTPTNMIINQKLVEWTGPKVALVNNYGASGSNASIIVEEPPIFEHQVLVLRDQCHPIWLCAYDQESLTRRIAQIRKVCQDSQRSSCGFTFADMAFAMARQANRSLSHSLLCYASSFGELESQLAHHSDCITASLTVRTRLPVNKPLILCFGGQGTGSIGLARSFLMQCTAFKQHLDDCDAIMRKIGLESVYPAIYQKEDLDSSGQLQLLLFTTQYACGKTWIDCGLTPVTVIGHSFGEIAALCVAGRLLLEDAVRAVHCRAQLIGRVWTGDRGVMLAVQCSSKQMLESLMKEAARNSLAETINIACYNGEEEYTLAGTTVSMQRVQRLIEKDEKYSMIRCRRLKVNHAYHSALVTPLVDGLQEIDSSLTWQDPVLPVESSHTQDGKWVSSTFFADQMRNPVYFDQAVLRIVRQHGHCVWLEAGSGSYVVQMIQRILKQQPDHVCLPVKITSFHEAIHDVSTELAKTSFSLWQAGVDHDFWLHHKKQVAAYKHVLLPAYPFAKTRHWMHIKDLSASAARSKEPDATPEALLSLHSSKQSTDGSDISRYKVNVANREFRHLLRDHVVVRTAAICSTVVQMNLAIEAVRLAQPDFSTQDSIVIENVKFLSPARVSDGVTLWVEVTRGPKAASSPMYEWRIIADHFIDCSGSEWQQICANGEAKVYQQGELVPVREFQRAERLFKYRRCSSLLETQHPSHAMSGPNIYRAFADVLDYGTTYRNLSKIVGLNDEAAGVVHAAYSGTSWVEPVVTDAILQVPGIHVNLMADLPESDMAIGVGIEGWLRRPDWQTPGGTLFHVYVTHTRLSDKALKSDVAVFSASDGRLLELIFGIEYAQITKISMQKLLSGPTSSGRMPKAGQWCDSDQSTARAMPGQVMPNSDPDGPTETEDVSDHVRRILASLSDVSLKDIEDTTEISSLGVDSLMAMELKRELDGAFRCALNLRDLGSAVHVDDIVVCVQKMMSGRSAGSVHGGKIETGQRSNKPLAGLAMTRTSTDDLLPVRQIIDIADSIKLRTDKIIQDVGIYNYLALVDPEMKRLCEVLVKEAFNALKISTSAFGDGQAWSPPGCVRPAWDYHQQLVTLIDHDTNLTDSPAEQTVQSVHDTAAGPSLDLKRQMLKDYPEHLCAIELTHYVGSNITQILTGKTDGAKLMFGDLRARLWLNEIYGNYIFNAAGVRQLVGFVEQVAVQLPEKQALRVVEVGAGTTGLTKKVLHMIEGLNRPVSYLVTDISPSMVSAAKRAFRDYKSVQCDVLDIEQSPSILLRGSQDLVIAHNCVHATQSLQKSCSYLRQMLRPNGILLLMEMTTRIAWIDLVFGMFEGWHKYSDGRNHAIADQHQWLTALKAAGFGFVDFTDGVRPEAGLQRVFIAVNTG